MKKLAIPIVLIVIFSILIHSGCVEQTATHENTNNEEETMVNVPPSVVLQAEPAEGTFPLTVSFTGIGKDTDGTTIHYYWDFDDGATAQEQNTSHTFTKEGLYEVVLAVTDDRGATALARLTITVNPKPADWTLTLIGAQTKTINKSQFESYINQYEEVSWEEEDNTWTGLPLWYLVAMVDDLESEGEYTLNEELADRGYTVKLTAGDEWETYLKSHDVAHDNGYVVMNQLNGEPLPKYTPRGKPSWPLHLRGTQVVSPNNIGNITTIELIDLPEDTSENNQPVRSFLRNLFEKLFPRWYNFFLDIKYYITIHRT